MCVAATSFLLVCVALPGFGSLCWRRCRARALSTLGDVRDGGAVAQVHALPVPVLPALRQVLLRRLNGE